MTIAQLPTMSEIQAMNPAGAFSALRELFAEAGHEDIVSSRPDPDKVEICYLLDMAPRLLSADAKNPELQTCFALCAVIDPAETASELRRNDCTQFKAIKHTPEALKSVVSVLARTKESADMLVPFLSRTISLLPTIAERKDVVLNMVEHGAAEMAYCLTGILSKLLKADCPEVVTAVADSAPEKLALFLGSCLSRLGEKPSVAENIALKVAQRAPSAFLDSAPRFRNSLSEASMERCKAAAQTAQQAAAAQQVQVP